MDLFKVLRIQVFLKKKSFADILRGLVDAKKKTNPNFSQNSISAKLGFKAKSHLSDILAGRRRFPEDKIKSINDVFNLSGPEQFLLVLIFNLERASDEEKINIEIQISKTMQILQSELFFQATPMANSMVAADLFFYILKINSSPSLNDICNTHHHYEQSKILSALQILEEKKIIEKYGDTYKLLELELTSLLYCKEEQVVKESFKAASRSIGNWFEVGSDTLFGMNLVTARYANLSDLIAEFREACLDFFVSLEDINSPNTLLRFNLAFYPIGRKIPSQPNAKK